MSKNNELLYVVILGKRIIHKTTHKDLKVFVAVPHDSRLTFHDFCVGKGKIASCLLDALCPFKMKIFHLIDSIVVN